MQELDPTQYGEADRQAVDPPVEVQVATWSAARTLDGGSENAASGSAGCAGRTDANDGSRLLIFVLHARVDRSPVAEQPEQLDHACRSACVGIVESSAVCF